MKINNRVDQFWLGLPSRSCDHLAVTQPQRADLLGACPNRGGAHSGDLDPFAQLVEMCDLLLLELSDEKAAAGQRDEKTALLKEAGCLTNGTAAHPKPLSDFALND